MYSLGWLSTGRDEAARQLLATVQDAIQKGESKAQIAFVFSNREPGENQESDRFFDLVREYRIPLVCLSSNRFRASQAGTEWRPAYEREAMQRLGAYRPDLCVLAGYMLIVGEEMCRRYPMINLHPAAPGGPTGTWQEVIWKLIEARARETGVMMHRVTPELDRGPVATYCTFPIRGQPFDKHWHDIEDMSVEEIKREQGEDNALFRLIRSHGVARELPLILATLKAFSEGKLRFQGYGVVNSPGQPIHGHDLTEEIEATLRHGVV
ncbi:MAG: formyltransferase family protein [Chloroflexota bacterium]|nr:formyltransferase family protein [Chloroflexota bacterium]